MKNKVLMAAIAAVVSVGAYAGFNSYRANSGSSDLLLENAEALSTGEATEVPCSISFDDWCTYPAKTKDGIEVTMTTKDMRNA